MRAEELEVNGAYTWVRPYLSHPRKAVVLEEASGGQVLVRIEHPDTGGEQTVVHTRELVNGWDEVPDTERFDCGTGMTARITRAREQGVELTWARIAEEAYDHVRRSRALADRLTALGIPRGHQHYAGTGGSDNDLGARLQLVLDYNELEQLIGLAEMHPLSVNVPARTLETT